MNKVKGQVLKIGIRNNESEDSYFVRHKSLNVFLRFELGQGNDLGADLQAHGHDGVHGVNVEEREYGDSYFLRGVGLSRSKHGHA